MCVIGQTATRLGSLVLLGIHETYLPEIFRGCFGAKDGINLGFHLNHLGLFLQSKLLTAID
jgi:hypothetical protein